MVLRERRIPARIWASGEVVGQFAGTADLDAVVKDENLNAVADEIIPVDQGIDQQFFEHNFGDFEIAETIKILAILGTVQGAFYKIKAALVQLRQRTANVFAVMVFLSGNVSAGKPDRGDEVLRDDFFGVLRKQQRSGHVEAVAVGQPEVGEQTRQVVFIERGLVLGFVKSAEVADIQLIGDGEGSSISSA